MRISRTRVIAALIAVTVAATTGCTFCLTGFAEKTTSGVISATQSKDEIDYSTYIASCPKDSAPKNSVKVDLLSMSVAQNSSLVNEYQGKTGAVVLTGESGKAEWKVNLPESGLYSIELEYYPIKGTNSTIQRNLLIDGKIPFEEASQLEFDRVFTPESSVNETLQTSLKEKAQWLSTTIKDASGLYNELEFYFTAGEHRITLESVAEPMAISSIVLNPSEKNIPDYITVLEDCRDQGISEIQGVLTDGILKVQAENAEEMSSPALYGSSDNSSPINEPYQYDEQKINVIGGSKWQDPGTWITWRIEVPKSGLYHIGYRFKQNYLRDIQCVRSLYINGKIPFREAQNLKFEFDNNWQIALAGGDEPYLFYLDKGVQTITMEVVLGELTESLVATSQSMDHLNNASWRLLTLIGSDPDLYRDYNIDQYMPDVVETFRQESVALKNIAQKWVEMTGKQDSNVAQMNQLSYQLEEMVKDPDQIPALYSQFRDSLSTFANLLLDVKKQPLLLDYIFISEPQAELPKANANLWVSMKDGILRFFSSFFNDYNNLSGGDGNASITVWVGNGLSGGRDQALVLRRLIEQDFTPKNNISVNLQLVPSATILTATVAGIGPDVALQVSGSEPANYAMRGAVADLSEMPDFEEIAERFAESALTPYRYLDGVYALPETFSYLMMFYRQDILAQLGINIESIKTWQDIISALPTIQGQNMNVSLMPNFNSYATFLYQMQGEFYTDDGKKSALDTKTALDSFHFFMRFFTDYNLPYAYNFVTRFRTGEIVIGIEDYTNYNLLQISAPEISGKWGMTMIPGIRDAEGNIRNTSSSTGSGCVLMSASKEKERGWQFMKWLTSGDTQYQYGKDLEGVMGVGARYNTANLEALTMLPWKTADKQVLLEQMKATQGVPEVPGGYMTSRNVGFAIATVYSDNVSTRDTLLGYVDQINQEMLLKRREFGLE